MKTQTEETKAVMYAGLPGHTIGIKLFNPEDQSVLYVDEDPHGHQITCEICNLAERGLTIPKGAGEPGPKNYHFAICFRKGILAIESVNSSNSSLLPKVLLDSDTGWKMSEAMIEEHRIVFYFLNQGDPIQLEPRDLLSLTLTGLRADVKNGVRTTRVELLYHQLYYTSNPDEILNGTRLHLLNIINHLGHQTSPLRIQFRGSHQVLNNGEKNTLLLQVTNTMKDRDLIFDEKAILVFWYQTEDIEDHQKLVEDNLAFTLTVIDLDGKKLSIDIGSANSNLRTLELLKSGIKKLAPHTSMIIQLEITTELPAGIAQLYINQEGLKGYWNHSFTLPVERTPMVFHENRVGIGYKYPSSKLQIQSDISSPDLIKQGAISIYADIVETKSANDNSVPYKNKKKPGALQIGIEDGYSWIQSHKSKPLMINPAGNNVGIGTEEAKVKLEVVGNINVNGKVKENSHDLIPQGAIMMWAGETAPKGWVLCDGGDSIKDAAIKKKIEENKIFIPDLRERFIVGSGNNKKIKPTDGFEVKATGGNVEAKLTIPEHKTKKDGEHIHRINFPTENKRVITEVVLGKAETITYVTKTEIFTSKNLSDGSHMEDHHHIIPQQQIDFKDTVDHLPPFYALAFIIKI